VGWYIRLGKVPRETEIWRRGLKPNCYDYFRAFVVCATLSSLPGVARAVSMQLEFSPFTGGSSSVLLNLSDDGGIITGQVSVVANPNIGDLRALFIELNDLSILSGNQLNITGALISETVIDANNVTSVGNANVNGGGSPGPFDIGIAFGSPGIGSDDIQNASFIIEHESTDLTLGMFNLSNWAVRLTSVGTPGGSREDSSKLNVTSIRLTGLTPPDNGPPGGELTPQGDPQNPGFPGNAELAPIPEPGTAALIIISSAVTGIYLRKRRRET